MSMDMSFSVGATIGRALSVLALSSFKYASSYIGPRFCVTTVFSKSRVTALLEMTSSSYNQKSSTYAAFFPNANFLLRLDFLT